MVANMNVWIDGNGRSCGRSLAAAGPDLYTVTTSGKIFVLAGETGETTGDPTAGTDSSGETGSDASAETSGDASGSSGAPTSGGDAPTSNGETHDSSVTGDNATTGATGSADETASGCACKSTRAPNLAGAILVLAALATRRRRRL